MFCKSSGSTRLDQVAEPEFTSVDSGSSSRLTVTGPLMAEVDFFSGPLEPVVTPIRLTNPPITLSLNVDEPPVDVVVAELVPALIGAGEGGAAGTGGVTASLKVRALLCGLLAFDCKYASYRS